jgi:hypothetical protein
VGAQIFLVFQVMYKEYKFPSNNEALNAQVGSNSKERYFSDSIELVLKTQSHIRMMRDHRLNTHNISLNEARANKFLNPVRRLIGVDVGPTELVPTESKLIDQEMALGGSLFRESLPGVDCKFFYQDKGSWFFSQSVQTDQADGSYDTIRYQVSNTGVSKILGARWVALNIEEFDNFVNSVQDYHKLISTYLYNDHDIESGGRFS